MKGSRAGTVFNVQGYSIHDGPGIRTTVFLKGCPLRCLWCQNPESQQAAPELFFNAEQCIGCGACVDACESHAVVLHEGKSHTNRTVCNAAGACTTACPSGARSLMGYTANVDEVFEAVVADRLFYDRSGGGVTLSGGEPLAQPLFAAELLQRCRQAGIHTALDTCGYAPWQGALKVLAHVDLVLYDFKHMDSAEHRRLTGVGNELILENALRIHHELKIPLLARVPLIPGSNDSEDNLRATALFIALRLSKTVPVHLNAYHPFGQPKVERLERTGPVFSAPVPDGARLDQIKRLFESYGLAVAIGG